jgi:hypothetical protein
LIFPVNRSSLVAVIVNPTSPVGVCAKIPTLHDNNCISSSVRSACGVDDSHASTFDPNVMSGDATSTVAVLLPGAAPKFNVAVPVGTINQV